MGDFKTEWLTQNKVDGNNNHISTGMFYGSIDADPSASTFSISSNNINYQTVFIQKLDENGNFIWAISFDGVNEMQCNSMEVDDHNNIYIGGWFKGTFDFDPGAGVSNYTASGNTDMFYLKLNSFGQFQWVKIISCDGFISEMKYKNGKLIMGGMYMQSADFDPGAGNTVLDPLGTQTSFILKIDTSGNFNWAKTMDVNNGYSYITSVNTDNNENIIICGDFSGDLDLDPSLSNSIHSAVDSYDIFWGKYDTNGNFLWANSIPQNGDQNSVAILPDSNYNFHLIGTFYGNFDGDPGPPNTNIMNNGDQDIFWIKSDSNGNYLNSFGIGSNSYEIVRCAELNKHNEIVLSGNFSATMDFNPGNGSDFHAPLSINNPFLMKIDNNGMYKWSNIYCGAKSVTYDNKDNIYLAGIYSPSSDLDPDTTVMYTVYSSNSSADIFISKLKECYTSYDTIVITNCVQVVVNATTYTSTGIFQQTLTNARGCDSLLTLIIDVIEPIQSVCISTIDTANFNSVIVSWNKSTLNDQYDSVKIYRETAVSGNFVPIGAVHKDSLSEFHDTSQVFNSYSQKYKLKVLDTCGFINEFSDYHATVFLQYNGTGNLHWEAYDIENSINEITGFKIYRDDLGNQNFNLISSLPIDSLDYFDPDYFLYPMGGYVVSAVLSQNCESSKSNYSESFSNYRNINGLTVNETALKKINIFPNPSRDYFHIESEINTNAEMYNMQGELIRTFLLRTGINTFYLENINSGIYYLKSNNTINKIILL